MSSSVPSPGAAEAPVVFTQTLLGRATAQVLRFIGVRRSLGHLERSFRNGNNYLRVRTEEQGPGRVRLFFTHTVVQPEYLRGIVLAGGRYLGARDFRAELRERGPEHCTFDVSWQEG